MLRYSPYGVVLHMLGVQAGVKVHHRLEGSQATVEEQQQELELGVRGTVRQTLLQETQTLPRHVFIPYIHTRADVQRRLSGWTATSGAERNSPVSVHRSM